MSKLHGKVVGDVSYREGDGMDMKIPQGDCEIEETKLDVTLGWQTAIRLDVNGSTRQSSTLGKLIWSVPEIIEQLSAAWALAPGDLIFTGTPEGVAAVVAGDRLAASIEGVGTLQVEIVGA